MTANVDGNETLLDKASVEIELFLNKLCTDSTSLDDMGLF